MTLDELLVVMSVFDIDFNPNDEGDVEWIERSLKTVNERLKKLHKRKK